MMMMMVSVYVFEEYPTLPYPSFAPNLKVNSLKEQKKLNHGKIKNGVQKCVCASGLTYNIPLTFLLQLKSLLPKRFMEMPKILKLIFFNVSSKFCVFVCQKNVRFFANLPCVWLNNVFQPTKCVSDDHRCHRRHRRK